MDEQNIPIDINTSKLLDWLISRRHVNKDWQNNILKVREKINNAIQDMPAHEGIIKLLSGQHINYFHCLSIVEILKETEADTKNLFGRYGSQRMKDWQDIIHSYEKDNIYLAEVSQILIRNVNFEVPSLRKQITRLEQTRVDCEKKIKDYTKTENLSQNEFIASCKQLGIPGINIREELIGLLDDLDGIFIETEKKVKEIQPAIDLYEAFNKFLLGKDNELDVLITLSYIVKSGNTTTYEYTYGEKPVAIELPLSEVFHGDSAASDDNVIDFGGEIDFSIIDSPAAGEVAVDEQTVNIDWGESENGFEVIEHIDLNINLEESGIVVEKSGLDGGIARGVEALTILDNPKTREAIINELVELEAFLKMRLFEMSNESDLLSVSQMQEASNILQMQTFESVTALHDIVQVALNEFLNKRSQHLHNIKHSPKYVDLLTESLKQKLDVVERMRVRKVILEEKIKEVQKEIQAILPTVHSIIEKSKVLQKQIESDISKRYKGRPVNIVGGINTL